MKFPIGLKENLQEEDNLSTRDNWPVPNVSFVRRFYCNRIGPRKTSELPKTIWFPSCGYISDQENRMPPVRGPQSYNQCSLLGKVSQRGGTVAPMSR